MKRIGILGGTFNPIHKGHIMLAREAYEQYPLDAVLVMPNKIPAYKDTKDIVDTVHRGNMVQLAIQMYPYMEYSDLELKREGETYTIHTLYELHNMHPDTIYYFIIGGDSLAYLNKWYQHKNILREAIILCARRGEDDFEELKSYRSSLLKEVPEAQIEFLQTDMVNISSTELRTRLKEGQDVSEWVSDSVLSYIKEHHLYEAS